MKQELKNLEEKIAKKEYLLGIIGLGYVGLPLSLTFLRKGHFGSWLLILTLIKSTEIHAEISYIKHIPSDELAGFVQQDKFSATADFFRLKEPDVLLLCVPTPLTQNREPDMQFIESTARSIAKELRPGQLVILESTTYPGTTVDLLQPILERSGLKGGRRFCPGLFT